MMDYHEKMYEILIELQSDYRDRLLREYLDMPDLTMIITSRLNNCQRIIAASGNAFTIRVEVE